MSPIVQLRRSAAPQSGVGMIEVLAALFVLSVGLLGVAGLQAQGLRAGHSASQRSVAVIKAYEIIERMRANPDAVLDSAGATFYAAGFAFDSGSTPDPFCADSDGSGPGAQCTPVQLANYDIFAWKESIDAAFTNMDGQGAINVTLPGGPNQPVNVVVTVRWNERGNVQNYTTETQFIRFTAP